MLVFNRSVMRPRRFREIRGIISVPIAPGKHLFTFRTQKLSPVAAIILRKWETSTVPNYRENSVLTWVFSWGIIIAWNIIPMNSGLVPRDHVE